jgi:uncharacterized membrane protein
VNLEFLEWIAIAVDAAGVGVMVLGFGFAMFRFVPTLWRATGAAAILEIQEIRCSLGTYLVFALELMIVSDLLRSVLSHKLEDLYFLGSIVAIRTVIAFFLAREIQEISSLRRQPAN